MEAKLNADHTQELFDKMSNLISEAILRFTEEGLEVTTADPAMVSMIHLEVPRDSFEEYEVDTESEDYEQLTEEGEEGLLIGIDLENLSAIVKLFDEEIKLSVEESQLILEEGSDKFELPILNLSTNDIPSMEQLNDHSVKAEITNDQFKTLIGKLAVATDSTTATLNGDGTLEMEGGNDQISVETSLELDNPEIMGEDVESAQSMFALDYLSKAQSMFKKLDTCDDLTLKMGEDFPLDMTHEDDRETLKFVLAPRIEEN